jgi:hypothetical protein
MEHDAVAVKIWTCIREVLGSMWQFTGEKKAYVILTFSFTIGISER